MLPNQAIASTPSLLCLHHDACSLSFACLCRMLSHAACCFASSSFV
jgi:hypothetical protein